MADIYSKLHGTTVDRFQIGTKSQQITLTGVNLGSNTIDLLDRDSTKHTENSTVFFTANIVGTDSSSAAFEIRGCYINGSGVSGTVINTYLNTSSIPTPTVTFDNNGLLTISCTGISGENIRWTAIIDFVKI